MQVKRQVEGKSQFVTLTPERQARFVADAVSTFCSTHASYPAPRHLQFPSWVAASEAEALRDTLYPYVEQRWLQSIDPRHPAGIGHDIYLKLWALSKPVIPADFILFDEAQDADPLMMGILSNQPNQVIYVGDAHQQIYEWRGAVNAMKRLPLPQTLLGGHDGTAGGALSAGHPPRQKRAAGRIAGKFFTGRPLRNRGIVV